MHYLMKSDEDSGFDWSLLLAGNRPAEGRLQVTSPFDGSLVAEVDTAGAKHVEDALRIAHQQFSNRDGWIPVDERIGILERTARLMTKEHAQLAMNASLEGGKPLADSQVEVTRAIESLRLAGHELKTNAGEVIPLPSAEAGHGRLAFTQHEPIGVVVAVSAFNHPLNLVVHQVATAVAAGCPVIVKPSEETPLSCLRFVQLLHQAGLSRQWAQVIVTAEIPVAEKLVTDPRVGLFSFIGSPGVGWMLRSKLAPGTRCVLEHGGAAPVILAPDADHQLALRSILKGGFYHAGQVCVSVQRVYVPRDRAESFALDLARQAEALALGNPTDGRTDVGPLIRPREVERVHQWVQQAIDAGATCLSGGKPRNNRFYECTVLLNPPKDARVSQREIFGPVVCVYAYDHLDEAIEAANSLPFAFQGAVFTHDTDTAMHVFRHLDASAVMLNDHTAFRVDGMPFAGLRQSGLGVGGIPYTIRDMQIQKMLVLNSGGREPWNI